MVSTIKILKMKELNLLICPLCQSDDNEFVSSYPGTFLSCKELLQCQNCELIFAEKLPSKKDLDNIIQRDCIMTRCLIHIILRLRIFR